jgi:SAM-dependent MidA family methyltransferase
MQSQAALEGASRPAADEAGRPELVDRIRDEIVAAPDRRITFARFMERALTEPGLGYYATRPDAPTRSGDFLTAPELHPFFGRLIGRHLADVWTRLGEPARFTVREYGAGSGTLERTVRAGLAADGSARARALAWQPVDLGAVVPDERVTGAILANEFLDALPVHRIVQRADRLLERYVTWNGNGFASVEDEPSTGRLAEVVATDGVELSDGQEAEISLDAVDWASRLGSQLERGVALVIDYGHPAAELFGPRRTAGTLMTYAGHQAGDDPFVRVGLQDLTTHVDLTAIDREARAGGLELIGSTTQARFLAALGLADLLSDLGRLPDTAPDDYLLARSAVVRLLDPRQLGGFAVRAWGNGIDAEPPLRGFEDPAARLESAAKP